MQIFTGYKNDVDQFYWLLVQIFRVVSWNVISTHFISTELLLPENISEVVHSLFQTYPFKIKCYNHLQEFQVHIFLFGINSLGETLQIQ